MAAFLSNIRYVAWTAIAVGLLFFGYYSIGVRGFAFTDNAYWEAGLRWAHVLSGIMWIGHLYYFNFTQIPNAPKIPEEHRGPAIAKVIAPAALFWFRWAAMATLITGALLAMVRGYLVQALTFTMVMPAEGGFSPEFAAFIGAGMWLAIIMWFNVWFIIWPAQQRALNIEGKFSAISAEEKAAAGKRAMMFSRLNTLLSVPMLVAMTGAQTLG